MNPIAVLEQAYLTEKPRPRPDTIWASQVGLQDRRFLFERDASSPTTTVAQDARRLEAGNQRADALRAHLVHAFDGHIPTSHTQERLVHVRLDGAWTVSGRPDGILLNVVCNRSTYRRILLEIKTMSAYGFQRLVRGEVPHDILAQIQILLQATGLEACYLLVENRQTGQLHDQIIQRDQGFIDSLILDLKRQTALVDAGEPPLSVDPCEGNGYGLVEKKIRTSTHSKVTAQALDWRCSYCPFARYCYPHFVRLQTEKTPAWIHELMVPPGSEVLDIGADIIPKPDWSFSHV